MGETHYLSQQELPRQDLECFQHPAQCLEVISVQHQDQTKKIRGLHTFHPPVQRRVLEDDKKCPHLTVHFHEHQKNIMHISA